MRARSSSVLNRSGLGVSRPIDGDGDGSALPDMGAYEYVNPASDTDGVGLNDESELYRYGTDMTNPDTDGDGRTDGDEVAMGYSPIYDEAPAIADGVSQGEANVTNNPVAYSLYTSNSVHDLDMGALMISVSNTTAQLWMQMEQTDDLVGGVWTNAGAPVLWSIPVTNDAAFYRVNATP